MKRKKYYTGLLIVWTMYLLSGCAASEMVENAANESIKLTEGTECLPEITEAVTEELQNPGTEDNQTEASRDIFAMDTYMTVTVYGFGAEEAAEQAEQEILRLDELLSAGKETSEVFSLNQNGGGTLSEETAYLVERSLELYEDTNGAFDIAIYPVMREWGFTTGDYNVPEADTIQSLLPLIDASQIIYEEENALISFEKEGMQIDLGGIAKGYTSSRIMDIFRKCGIASGIVNLGGNVQVFGTKPDQSLWRVAIQSPKQDESFLGVLSVSDKAVITSGGYERYFEQDGKTYHHIIDPATGYPAENGLASVTIVSADGTLADGLSTSLFIMGKEKAIDYWQGRSEMFDAILLTDEGELYVTEGIADCFTSDFEIQIVRKGEF